MQMVERQYGSSGEPIYFELWEADGTDFESTPPTFAAGDTQISDDGSAFSNTTNDPVHEGGGVYSWTPAGTELETKQALLRIVDQTATKVWLDKLIVIETVGHPLAQHKFRDIALPEKGGLITGTPTSTTAALAGNLPATDDIVNGSVIYFSAGTGAGQTRTIVDYDQATDTVTVDPAWATTPDTTTVYHILPAPPATEAAANLPDTNAGAIGGDSAAASTLALSIAGLITGTAATGTLSTTQATTDLTGFADDQLIGRTLVFTGGAADGEATDITDYASASGLLTFTALTTAPGDTDPFVIF